MPTPCDIPCPDSLLTSSLHLPILPPVPPGGIEGGFRHTQRTTSRAPTRTRLSMIFGITGLPGSGKTTLLRLLHSRATALGIDCGGFLQLRVEDRPAHAVAYQIKRLRTGRELTIAQRRQSECFEFFEDAFIASRQWVLEEQDSCELMILDELGKLEANGDGHAESVEALRSVSPTRVIVVSLRKDALDVLCKRFHIPPQHVLDLDQQAEGAEPFLTRILDHHGP